LGGRKIALLEQKNFKNACEIFHDKAHFAALTPYGFLAGGIVYRRK
jgi:hypothetical protein